MSQQERENQRKPRYSSVMKSFRNATRASAVAQSGGESEGGSSESRPQSVGSEDSGEAGSQGSKTREDGSAEVSSPAESTTSTFTSTQDQDMVDISTMEEPARDVYAFILTRKGTPIAGCFVKASIQPPVTLGSLLELDLPRIINNPKLRWDINFDRDLHFRANFDGSKGKEKIKAAHDFWSALEAELSMYFFVQEQMMDPTTIRDEGYWKTILTYSEKRLPKVLDVIREILLTLVPDYDQDAVSDRLNTAFMMQEIKNGVCDLVDLANWFAKVLKTHCAPMRDNAVDYMANEIKKGATNGQTNTLVNGIRLLLSIVEYMKIDVANHQIRHMRGLLVEDTINFQHRYNEHRIAMKKVDVRKSRLWLGRELEKMDHAASNPTHLEALTTGVLYNLLFSDSDFGDTEEWYPSTFYLDADKLHSLRIELRSTVYHVLAREILYEMAGSGSSPPSDAELEEASEALRNRIIVIVGIADSWDHGLENIAAEIMRIVLWMEGRKYEFDEVLLNALERRLFEDIRPFSKPFESRAHELFDRLLPKLQHSVKHHINLSALQLHDILNPPPPVPIMHRYGFGATMCAPPPVALIKDPDASVIRRMTHMLALHWHVWADLVYLKAPAEDETSSDDDDEPPTPKFVPVAQAVYAPGRKWLPIGVRVIQVPTGTPHPPGSTRLDCQPKPRDRDDSDDDAPTEPSSVDDSQTQQQRAGA